MANRLKVAMIQALVTLWRQGWSQRQIAKRLGVDRDTAGCCVRRLEALANPANVDTGSAMAGNSGGAVNKVVGMASCCGPSSRLCDHAAHTLPQPKTE